MHGQWAAYTVYIGKTGAFYMKKWKTKWLSLLLALVLITSGTVTAFPQRSFAQQECLCNPPETVSGVRLAPDMDTNLLLAADRGGSHLTFDVEIESPAACLMELTTGKILYEKEADIKRSPASVTKIMTVLLIMEAIQSGKIALQDEVVTSAHAKSMGGSQVFLEEGEKQTVETLLKCILVASGNDASVAMAEYIGGSEEAFVQKMNERAAALDMKNTHFVDCCGLTDSDEHYTTPRDIAIMSRELLLHFPQVEQYTTIWMEDITHVTAKGSSAFGLTNTNKLLRSYDGCIGLKTGSTSKAKFCVSAAAKRGDITLISVIMAGPDSKIRFANAAALLNYGFGICRIYKDEEPPAAGEVRITGGKKRSIPCVYRETFSYLDTEGVDFAQIECRQMLETALAAPVKKGTKAGELQYFLNGQKIGSVDILTEEEVARAGLLDYFMESLDALLMQNKQTV